MRHTFSITLGNGDKGDITVDMPDSSDDDAWTDRSNDPNMLARGNWTIAVQSGARKCKTLDEAQAYCDDYKHGVRAPRAAKVVTVAKDMEWTSDQMAELEAQGVKFN